MKIIVDTNIVASGVFFGGPPRKVLEAIASEKVAAFAADEITAEYHETIAELLDRYNARFDAKGLSRFETMLNRIEPKTKVDICRDPDDNKFISCAIDAKALYIVSGDKDLLTIKDYQGVEIVTAREFCDRYLS